MPEPCFIILLCFYTVLWMLWLYVFMFLCAMRNEKFYLRYDFLYTLKKRPRGVFRCFQMVWYICCSVTTKYLTLFQTCYERFSYINGPILTLQMLNVNPFTAMFANVSPGKRPVKVPNLKTLRLCPLFAWARVRISIKMHNIEIIFVIGPSNTLFPGVCGCTFQPGHFTGCGS